MPFLWVASCLNIRSIYIFSRISGMGVSKLCRDGVAEGIKRVFYLSLLYNTISLDFDMKISI